MKHKTKSNEQIVTDYYKQFEEDNRVSVDAAHMVEYNITMDYIEKYVTPGCKILELGCGTGIYSLELAKRGYDVTAIDISEKNLKILEKNITPEMKIKILQANSTNLSALNDDTFDICLCFGPLYHLFNKTDIDKTINEIKRVTKQNGMIFIAYLSQDYIMMRMPDEVFENPDRYLDKNYNFISNMDEAFYYFKIQDFDNLMKSYELDKITLFTMDGITSFIRHHINKLSKEAYNEYINYLKANCERQELLGFSPHLCYITKNKKN